MGKYKETLLDENYTVGDRVRAFTHQQCLRCNTWFRYSFDEAISYIRQTGHFNLVCPECEQTYSYKSPSEIVRDYLVFKECE
jgi:hypothetical protein